MRKFNLDSALVLIPPVPFRYPELKDLKILPLQLIFQDIYRHLGKSKETHCIHMNVLAKSNCAGVCTVFEGRT